MGDELIRLINVSKDYTDKVGYRIHLLEDISLSVKQNEFVTVLAPKGSGKSSLLKIICGLEKRTSGGINSGGKIVYIPTAPSSFPWLNVEQNISFNSKFASNEIAKIIRLVGLNGYEDHYPHKESEGFRFRMSFGRALANSPDVIVIDEPFNNLNSKTREEIYLMLRDIFEQRKLTIVFGTTNITEAIFLSDKIYLMQKNPGKIIEKLKVELKERKLSIMESKEFHHSRNEIEEIFKNKLERALYHFSV